MSANLRAMCAIAAPGRIVFFRYDWRRLASWNLAFAAGIVVGGAVAVALLGGGDDVALSAATRADLAAGSPTSGACCRMTCSRRPRFGRRRGWSWSWLAGAWTYGLLRPRLPH